MSSISRSFIYQRSLDEELVFDWEYHKLEVSYKGQGIFSANYVRTDHGMHSLRDPCNQYTAPLSVGKNRKVLFVTEKWYNACIPVHDEHGEILCHDVDLEDPFLQYCDATYFNKMIRRIKVHLD